MTYEQIRYETKESVGWIRLNRPERLNALTHHLSGEALDALEKRQAQEDQSKQRKSISSNAKLIFESARGPSYGNPQGDVTLVEFFDYNCGYCKRAMQDVMQLAKDDPKLKIVFNGKGRVSMFDMTALVSKHLK